MLAVAEITVGLVGDFCLGVRAHHAIPRALDLAAAQCRAEVTTRWIETRDIETRGLGLLRSLDAIWCTPGSPYENMEAALSAIRFAREHQIPFLGTCGGFQHALIEYARNVLGLDKADHAESNPAASLPLIAPRGCALEGIEAEVRCEPGSKLRRIYERESSREGFHCRFGVNSNYKDLFSQSMMKFCAVDEHDELCAFELEGQQFFLGTLFQPELSAANRCAHPLIAAFVEAAVLQAAKPSPLQQVLGL